MNPQSNRLNGQDVSDRTPAITTREAAATRLNDVAPGIDRYAFLLLCLFMANASLKVPTSSAWNLSSLWA